MTVGNLYNQFREYLEKHGIEGSGTDASFIIAHHLGLKPHELMLNRNKEVPPLKISAIRSSMKKRGKGMPAAYILGYKHFFQDKFITGPGALIPRADSEHIIYAADELRGNFKNIIDIGTGSGALALSLSRIYPLSHITALDINTGPLEDNIRSLGIKNVSPLKSDFLKAGDGIKKRPFLYDLIVSNPPYLSKEDMKKYGPAGLRFEPFKAFYGGMDGLVFYRAIALFSLKALEKDGYIIVEIDYKWAEIRDIFVSAGFTLKEIRKDYNGLERVMVVKLTNCEKNFNNI
ncbi:MAG: peptide chain release factor N(5)-glutamine methyltransferase [Brevinematales bacterium]|jgi:release factor glutamine methyltransferase